MVAAKKRRSKRVPPAPLLPSEAPLGPAARAAIEGAHLAALRRLDEHQHVCAECRRFVARLFSGARGQRCKTGEQLVREAARLKDRAD